MAEAASQGESVRYALGVEYDGSAYAGWQRQPNVITVQGLLEQALSRVANQPVQVQVAGRTDAGVHAVGQVVSFDGPAGRNARAWTLGVNCHLPADIRVTWARQVDQDFHARHSARSRRYRYLIDTADIASALNHRRAWRYPGALNARAMEQAAQVLLGEQDFSAFQAAGCQSPTAMRCLHEITVVDAGRYLAVDVEANAFLLHMVRNIVGTLCLIGAGRQPAQWLASVLAGRDRRAAGPTAPPYGLYLLAVKYPPAYGLPGLDESGGSLLMTAAGLASYR